MLVPEICGYYPLIADDNMCQQKNDKSLEENRILSCLSSSVQYEVKRMDIPNLSEITSRVVGGSDRLKEALTHRAAKRQEWTPEARTKYEEFLSKLGRANGVLRAHLVSRLVEIVEGMVRTGKSEYYWKFCSETVDSLDLQELNVKTIVYGRFDRNKDRHDGLSRMEAGLPLNFWADLDNSLSGKGFHVYDVSDNAKSPLKFVKVTIGDSPQPTHGPSRRNEPSRSSRGVRGGRGGEPSRGGRGGEPSRGGEPNRGSRGGEPNRGSRGGEPSRGGRGQVYGRGNGGRGYGQTGEIVTAPLMTPQTVSVVAQPAAVPQAMTIPTVAAQTIPTVTAQTIPTVAAQTVSTIV